MHRLLVVIVLAAACGDDSSGVEGEPVDAAPVVTCGPPSDADVAVQLAALPGVTVVEAPAAHAPGYRYFRLQWTQPVDHAHPDGATFTQQVSLLHRDLARPTIAFTTGYEDYQRDYLSEPAALVDGNQASIEHRFFGASRPAGAAWDFLTVAQQAADQHAIIAGLRCVYRGPWVSSGGSKGGMTAIYHRRFYPDDVAGTLAYVAPLSFAIPDHRYDAFLDGVMPAACRDAVRAVAIELLANRRAAMTARAQAEVDAGGSPYTRIALGPAVESAILDLEWAFWQYEGVDACGAVPPPTASDAALWSFLDRVSPVSFSADADTEAYEAYFFQAYRELGSPGTARVRGDSLPPHLAALTQYAEADYVGTLPVGVPVPTHDPAVMADVDAWLQAEGAHVAFLYGQYDPWSGGKFRLGRATDALSVETPQGTHVDGIDALAPVDRGAVLTKLSAWIGEPLSARWAARRVEVVAPPARRRPL